MKIQDDAIPFFTLIPNIITMLGICFGVTSIRMALSGKFETAALFILICALLDTFDGGIARLLNAQSKIGAQLDSFADLINFGFAPPLIMYIWALHDVRIFGWACVLLSTCCMALRLSRFNTEISDEPASFFKGIPAPMGGMFILLPLVLSFENLSIPQNAITMHLLCLYIAIICGLMISKIPTISLKKIRIPRRHSHLIVLAISCTFIGFVIETWKMNIILCLMYALFFPYGIYLSKKIEC